MLPGLPSLSVSLPNILSVNTTCVIDVQELSHNYGQRPNAQALRKVSFTVWQREIFALLGPNGGGKTTLFRVLATLLSPTSGTAHIYGCDVNRSPHEVRRQIGVVFQSHSLDRKLTIVENLRYQGHLYGLHGRRLHDRIVQLLEQFGLAGRDDHVVETLSDGLKRRVELAKGFLHRPQLLLLDEPSTGLDPGARLDFWKYIQQLRREEGVSIFLTTHFMDEAEKCDRLGILNRGQLVALDSPEALKSKVGGDVIVVQTRDPQSLRLEIEKKFSGTATVVDNTVRIERPRGHEFIAELVEAFPGKIEAVTLSKPTLEDVFIHETGHTFWWESTRAADRSA